jgi:hypothetical protein
MKSLLFLILASSLLLVTPACNKSEQTPAPEESCYFKQNVYEQRVSWAWNEQQAIPLFVDASVPEEIIEATRQAIKIWNTTFQAEFGYKIFTLKGKINKKVGVGDDQRNVISFMTAWDGDDKEQAETYLRWVGKVIYDADIRINGEKNLSVVANPDRSQLDAVSLMVHELGHVLGLDHIITDEYTTMAVSLGTGNVDRRQVSELDIDALGCEY